MNKKLTIIIALQALLIVTLFWVLVFYGRDEYEAYRAEQQEEIESPSRVSEKDGINVVSLPPVNQQNSGIATTKVSSAKFQGAIKSYGNVVSIDSLTEAKARALSLKTDIALARAASVSNMQQHHRLKTLNADDKNVSDRAVQEALAAVNADKAKITASELQLKNLQTSMKLQWGEVLTTLVFGDKSAPHLANLLERKNVLIQVSLPLNITSPKAGSSIHVASLNESVAPINAVYISPAATSDNSGFGKTFYYSAPAESLRIGMRVNVEMETNADDSANGIIIPSNAVVWYAGKPWAYFKQGKDQFVRKPIAADTEVATGWFNQGIDANSEVVVSGAQLLLSEEFKYQIKNENED